MFDERAFNPDRSLSAYFFLPPSLSLSLSLSLTLSFSLLPQAPVLALVASLAPVNESVNARRSVSHPPISVQTNARPSLFVGGENYFWQPDTEQCRQISAASTAQQTQPIVHERDPRRAEDYENPPLWSPRPSFESLRRCWKVAVSAISCTKGPGSESAQEIRLASLHELALSRAVD